MIENSAPEKNTYFLNVFQPHDALNKDALETAADISVKRIKGQGCIGVEISSKEAVETFLFSSTSQIDYDDIKSQSKWVSIVKDKSGKVIKTTEYDGG